MNEKIIAGLAAIVVLTVTACTREKPGGAPHPARNGATGAASIPAGGAPASSPAAGLVDQGQSCKGHEYRVRLGDSQTLPFAFKLPIPADDATTLAIETNQVADAGIDVSIADVSFDTYLYPDWEVDCPEAFKAMDEAGLIKPTSDPDRGFTIIWDPSGHGRVVSAVGNIRDLTEQQLRGRLGDKITFMIGGTPKSFDYTLNQGSIDGYIALVDITITAPVEAALGMESQWVTVKGQPAGEMQLRFTKDKNGNLLSVMGPDQRSQCLSK
jgi:hypothetical protein